MTGQQDMTQVSRLFDEVFTRQDLAVADEIMAEEPCGRRV
jgi:hypothetical protein